MANKKVFSPSRNGPRPAPVLVPVQMHLHKGDVIYQGADGRWHSIVPSFFDYPTPKQENTMKINIEDGLAAKNRTMKHRIRAALGELGAAWVLEWVMYQGRLDRVKLYRNVKRSRILGLIPRRPQRVKCLVLGPDRIEASHIGDELLNKQGDFVKSVVRVYQSGAMDFATKIARVYQTVTEVPCRVLKEF